VLYYQDAVTRTGIARTFIEYGWSLHNFGSTWLPLPQLLLIPLVSKLSWWQTGIPAAAPAAISYVAAAVCLYVLALRLMPTRWAIVAVAIFALNPNLLYLATTAMTEPTTLALTLAIILAACDLFDAFHEARAANRIFLFAGVGALAICLTRYDGWILCFILWCAVSVKLLRSPSLLRANATGYAVFSLLTALGPLLWFAYNHHFFHDWLAFERGPSSPFAVIGGFRPGGPRHYEGLHRPLRALLLYLGTVQWIAAGKYAGLLFLIPAVIGAVIALRRRIQLSVLLLWLPVPFYIYSCAFAWVPIHTPQSLTESYGFNNTRYGVALLPALAIYLAYALYSLELPSIRRLLAPVALALVIFNAAFMTLRHRVLVFREVSIRSDRWRPFEDMMHQQLARIPAGAPILADRWSSGGMSRALQREAIPMTQTIKWDGGGAWDTAAGDPAAHAALVIAADGDPIAAVVAAHPQGLFPVARMCPPVSTCVSLFLSNRFQPPSR
jgi:hypothetical protein